MSDGKVRSRDREGSAAGKACQLNRAFVSNLRQASDQRGPSAPVPEARDITFREWIKYSKEQVRKELYGAVPIIVTFTLLFSSAVWAQAPQLKKPDWTDCTVAGQPFACLTLEQTKHYLELYARYMQDQKEISLLEEKLIFHEKWELKREENLEKCLVQVSASSELIRKLRDAPPPDSGIPVWEVFVYVLVAVITGAGIGAGAVAIAK